MNQGLFFGQLVVGPAGCGKVTITIFSRLILSTCKIWLKH